MCVPSSWSFDLHVASLLANPETVTLLCCLVSGASCAEWTAVGRRQLALAQLSDEASVLGISPCLNCVQGLCYASAPLASRPKCLRLRGLGRRVPWRPPAYRASHASNPRRVAPSVCGSCALGPLQRRYASSVLMCSLISLAIK